MDCRNIRKTIQNRVCLYAATTRPIYVDTYRLYIEKTFIFIPNATPDAL